MENRIYPDHTLIHLFKEEDLRAQHPRRFILESCIGTGATCVAYRVEGEDGIPVKLNGLAQGVRDGGKLNLSIRKIDVTAPYKQIPEVLDIDVTNLQLGKAIKVGALQFEGLKIATSPEVVVCSVKATRASRSAAAAAAE